MQIFAFRCELQRFTMVICCISVVNSLQNHCNFMVNRCNFIVKISTICKVFTLIVMLYNDVRVSYAAVDAQDLWVWPRCNSVAKCKEMQWNCNGFILHIFANCNDIAIAFHCKSLQNATCYNRKLYIYTLKQIII